jgi:hypothetical protein
MKEKNLSLLIQDQAFIRTILKISINLKEKVNYLRPITSSTSRDKMTISTKHMIYLHSAKKTSILKKVFLSKRIPYILKKKCDQQALFNC